MGHIVRRATPATTPQREPLPTTKISELRLDELVRETREDGVADGTPIEVSTIAMPRLQRPDGAHVARLRSHADTAPTRQLQAQPDLDAVTVVATSVTGDPEAPPPAMRPASYPVAPSAGASLPRVLLVVLALTIAWLGASLIYAVR